MGGKTWTPRRTVGNKRDGPKEEDGEVSLTETYDGRFPEDRELGFRMQRGDGGVSRMDRVVESLSRRQVKNKRPECRTTLLPLVGNWYGWQESWYGVRK